MRRNKGQGTIQYVTVILVIVALVGSWMAYSSAGTASTKELAKKKDISKLKDRIVTLRERIKKLEEGQSSIMKKIGGVMPARLIVTSISTPSVKPGETASITVTVSNTGGKTGTKDITLKVAGETVGTQSVTVKPGSTNTVSFEVKKSEAGNYKVSAGGATATLTVKAGAGKQVTIRYWSSYAAEGPGPKSYMLSAVERFESKHPRINVELEPVPYEGKITKLLSAIKARKAPEIVDFQSERLGPFLAGGHLQPLTSEIKAWKDYDKLYSPLKEFLPVMWGKRGTGKKGWYVWPWQIKPCFKAWNTKWLDQANISYDEIDGKSLSWSEYKSILRELKNTSIGQKSEHYPSIIYGKKGDIPEGLLRLLVQNGLTGFLNSKATKVVIDSPAGVEAVKLWKTLYEEKLVNQDALECGDEESNMYLMNDKVGVAPNDVGDLYIGFMKKVPDRMKNNFYRYSLPLHKRRKGAMVWMNSFGVMKQAVKGSPEKLDAAVKFFKFMDSYDELLRLAKKTGAGPCRPAVLEEDYFKKGFRSRLFGTAKKTLKECKYITLPVVKHSGKINYDLLDKWLTKLLKGRITVKEFVDGYSQDVADTLGIEDPPGLEKEVE